MLAQGFNATRRAMKVFTIVIQTQDMAAVARPQISITMPDGSGPQDDLDVDAVRDLYPHQLSQGALVRVEVYEPLVDAHLPSVPGLGALAVRALAHRHLEPLGREWYRAGHVHACLLADGLDLVADAVYLLRVRSAQRYPGPLRHFNKTSHEK